MGSKPSSPKGGKKDDKGGAPKNDAPKKAKPPKVDVDGDDLDIKGGKEENPEEALKAIYDMLKDFFEGDKKDDKADAPEAPKGPEGPKNDVPPPPPPPLEDDMGMLQERFKKLANIIK